ncbi:MAG: hypothetical protein K1X28_00375 [Parachlamydiales bacterium]|nr:hypothetical protein [Parachlamydiales bacterium]
MTSAVGSSVAVQGVQPNSVTTPQMIQKAKDALMDFLKGEDFEQLAGSRIAFYQALKKPESPLGFIFREIIQQAEGAGYIGKDAGVVFFADDIDQEKFTAEVAQEMIAWIEENENVEIAPPAAEKVAQAKEKLLLFIHSDAFAALSLNVPDEFDAEFEEIVGSLANFKKLVSEIRERAEDEESAYLVNQDDLPGYAKLFDTIIRNGVDQHLLDGDVAETYFNPKMDQLRLIEAILKELG